MPFSPATLIIKKRDGHALSTKAIQFLIDAYTRGDVPDYQMSAFLMAGLLRGLSKEETTALTRAMLHSGTILDLSYLPGKKVDKHSTGGVGDKVSLILAPLVAACGVIVPMISGRGLGHSGGTLDKLESIPGFRTDLSVEAYRKQLKKIGVVMAGQTEEIAPADRKLYALRDVTGTIECVPYIAASIMSKKLAEGIDALVLDVKCGKGAFMKEESRARRLAETLVHTGEEFGLKTTAWMTRMDKPIGYGIGNWPEIAEAIRSLKGETIPELTELTCVLAGEMLYLGKAAASPEAGKIHALQALHSGTAFEKFVELVKEQGGNVSVLFHPEQRVDSAPTVELVAPPYAHGYITSIDALALGHLAVALGAGRRYKEDRVDPTAGILLNKQVGDDVEYGDILGWLYTKKASRIDDFIASFHAAFMYAEHPPEHDSILIDCYRNGQWLHRDAGSYMPR